MIPSWTSTKLKTRKRNNNSYESGYPLTGETLLGCVANQANGNGDGRTFYGTLNGATLIDEVTPNVDVVGQHSGFHDTGGYRPGGRDVSDERISYARVLYLQAANRKD
jgi:hypothetical protein